MRWSLNDDRRAGHLELLLKLVAGHPNCKADMQGVLHFDEKELTDSVLSLTRFSLPVPLCMERARFMLKLLMARRLYLLSGLDSQ